MMKNEQIDGKGIAYLKPEFILAESEESTEPAVKRAKLDEEPKSKRKGQFKNRYKNNKLKLNANASLCSTLKDVPEDAVALPECTTNNCKYEHDVTKYLKARTPDISDKCYVFMTKGYCPWGVTCRFGKNHMTENGRNIKSQEKIKEFEKNGSKILNINFKDILVKLRKKKYNFSKSLEIVNKLPSFRDSDTFGVSTCQEEKVEITGDNGVAPGNDTIDHKPLEEVKETEEIDPLITKDSIRIGSCSDSDLVKLRPEEKRMIDWSGKLYLSPLTTLGNLPFRRICKEFGADITCSEMAMATSLLQGLKYEWALMKRHESEDLFGIQLCGNNPFVLTKCAQLLEENAQVDYIDINLGCPIDAVYQKGGGSGLLRREKVLESVIRSMSKVMSLPLTVKTRTGVYADKNIAHKLIPMFVDAGASLVTVHGRSREQRYTRTADWSYINECARVASPIPVFGNGDILSYEDYKTVIDNYQHISGVMIGRGALYKPWIFKEIKENRHWDISSSERFDIIKKFVNYGLDHWGSDAMGVENTRRFTLEWLSFLYRYIPVGLLERPPQKINERPPRYVGRDDLETLMASPNCSDWVKITEMLLGPVPEGFQFLPKHKANAWAT